MKDTGANIMFGLFSASIIGSIITLGLNCFVIAETPMGLAKGGCIMLTAAGLSYASYRILKDKDF